MDKREKGRDGKLGRLRRRLPLSTFPRLPFATRSASSGGWTLIELVVTVTVLSILTLGVVPLIKTSVKRQREQRLRDSLREMRQAIKEFHRDTVGIQCAGAGGSPTSPTTPTAPGQPGQPAQPGGLGQPYLDPRSKVVISDCTIFDVENPDRYPPTLELLVEGVSVVPRANLAGAAGLGSVDTSKGGATDNKLVSTKKKRYLRSVPVDPMTGEAEWDLRSTYDASDASEWGGENVFDVRSKSKATALNGEKYSDW